MARTFGVKNKPTPTNPMVKNRFSAGDDDKKPENADRLSNSVEKAQTPPSVEPVVPVVDETNASNADEQFKGDAAADPLPPVERKKETPAPRETSAVEEPRSRKTAVPQTSVRVTAQLGIPAGMMDQLSKLADESQLDAGYLAEALIAKTISQIASDTALPTDAVSDPKQKFSMSRNRTFLVDGERFRQVRAKLDPLNVKPITQIAKAIYIGALAASFDEVKADVSK